MPRVQLSSGCWLPEAAVSTALLVRGGCECRSEVQEAQRADCIPRPVFRISSADRIWRRPVPVAMALSVWPTGIPGIQITHTYTHANPHACTRGHVAHMRTLTVTLTRMYHPVRTRPIAIGCTYKCMCT